MKERSPNQWRTISTNLKWYNAIQVRHYYFYIVRQSNWKVLRSLDEINLLANEVSAYKEINIIMGRKHRVMGSKENCNQVLLSIVGDDH